MNINKTMQNFGLGLSKDGRVVLRDHHAGWDEAFLFESQRIASAFTKLPLVIEHVGSTAISTICAKPILDLLIELPSLSAFDKNQSVMEDLGYFWKGEYGIPGRRYCVLYSEGKEFSFVHVHAFAKGDREIRKHLVFRDYLRAFPQVALEYENLKKDLSVKLNRAEYSEAKNEFIQKTLNAAYAWKSAQGG